LGNRGIGFAPNSINNKKIKNNIMAVFIGALSLGKKSCLTREFRKLKKKRSMAQNQKVAIALNVCNIPRKK